MRGNKSGSKAMSVERRKKVERAKVSVNNGQYNAWANLSVNPNLPGCPNILIYPCLVAIANSFNCGSQSMETGLWGKP